jgi:hypothetical protein
MKTLFVGINLCFGAVCAILGLAAMVSVVTAAYSYTYGIIGVFALMIAAFCLWLGCECGGDRRKSTA